MKCILYLTKYIHVLYHLKSYGNQFFTKFTLCFLKFCRMKIVLQVVRMLQLRHLLNYYFSGYSNFWSFSFHFIFFAFFESGENDDSGFWKNRKKRWKKKVRNWIEFPVHMLYGSKSIHSHTFLEYEMKLFSMQCNPPKRVTFMAI